MQFVIERSTLYGLIQKVMPATTNTGPLPICSCIRFEVRDGLLSLNATDGRSITIKAYDVCEVHEPGAVGTNAKALLDIISNFPDGPLSAKMAGNRLQFKNKKAAVHVTTVPEEHFPISPDCTAEFVPCLGFFEATKKVDFATVMDDPSRAWMSGVRVVDGRMAATDGHRLALIAYQHSLPPITIPSDLLRRAQKAVGDKAAVAFFENKVHFKGDKVIASISTLEGGYPDYQRIIPQTAYQDVKVSKKDLTDALDLIKATADQKSLTVTLNCADGVMKLSSKSEGAEGVHEIPAEFKEPVKVSVNLRYIYDVVDKIKSDVDVVFEFRSELTPLVIKEEGYVNVIMPQRPA